MARARLSVRDAMLACNVRRWPRSQEVVGRGVTLLKKKEKGIKKDCFLQVRLSTPGTVATVPLPAGTIGSVLYELQ